MKIQIVTIGKPKLDYAQRGWEEYLYRLQRLHTLRITQLADKYAYNAEKINAVVSGTYQVVLDIPGEQLSSPALATFLEKRALESREVSFIIGGPEGLPQSIREQADYHWSLSTLTLPHDLAMVVMLEALYRASTIQAHLPYHK